VKQSDSRKLALCKLVNISGFGPPHSTPRKLHTSEIGGVTSALLNSVLGRLETEIAKSLEYAFAASAPVSKRGRMLGWLAGQGTPDRMRSSSVSS
jgi:hypothetical protein